MFVEDWSLKLYTQHAYVFAGMSGIEPRIPEPEDQLSDINILARDCHIKCTHLTHAEISTKWLQLYLIPSYVRMSYIMYCINT